MTSEGSIERVPLKVVPITIDTLEPDPEEQPEAEQEQPEAPTVVRRRPWVGALGVALVVASIVLQVFAISRASAGDVQWGTVLGSFSIAVAVLAVIAGVVAVVIDRGRRAGVVAVVAGLVANPLILLAILRFFAGGTS